MAQSVSNDALWEKLSEIDKKLEEVRITSKRSVSVPQQVEEKYDFRIIKDEITTEIKAQTGLLGKHNDVNFAVVNQNLTVLDNNIVKALNVVTRIRKQQREAVKQVYSSNMELPKYEKNYFNFSFFKVRKTSLLVAVLSILVFILTVFCMKQQNDYSLLMDEYYRQGIIMQDQNKMDILDQK